MKRVENMKKCKFSEAFFFFFFNISFFLTMDFAPVVASRGSSAVLVHGLLIAAASLVAEHRLWGAQASGAAARRLNSCDPQAKLLLGIWGLLGSGIKPVSPVWAVRFLMPIVVYCELLNEMQSETKRYKRLDCCCLKLHMQKNLGHSS